MEQHLLTARLTRSVLLSEKTKHLEFEVEELPSFDFRRRTVHLRPRAARRK